MAESANTSRRKLPNSVFALSTYFAEGFPYSIVNNLPEVLFASLGVGLGAVGLTSLLHLPWNVKFLWAPLVERASLRRVLALTQLAMGALLAFGAPLAGDAAFLPAFSALLFAVAFLSATNDVATDGYYLEALSSEEQARFVGLRVLAYRTAGLLVRGPGVVVAGVLGFRGAFVAMGGLLASIGALHWFVLPEPNSSVRTATRRAPSLAATLRDILEGERSSALLAFVILFRLGESLLTKMRFPFLRDAFAVSVGEYGLWSGTVGVGVGFAGTLAGGFLLARGGLARWFWPCIAAQNGLNLAYAGLAAGVFGASKTAALGALLFDEFGSGLGTSVLMVVLLRASAGEGKTTRFAVLSALMSLTFTLAGAVSGFLAERVGYATFFALTFVASVPMMLLWFVVGGTLRPADDAPAVTLRSRETERSSTL